MYFWFVVRKRWLDNRPPSGVDKGTSGGHAISVSACEDNQLAVDTSVSKSSNLYMLEVSSSTQFLAKWLFCISMGQNAKIKVA